MAIDSKTISATEWVRILLPIALALFGWWIGQTAGKLESRIEELEDAGNLRQTMIIEHQSSADSRLLELERRVGKNEGTLFTIREADELKSRISALEQRILEHEKK